MLTAIITGPSFQAIKNQIQKANNLVDAFEFRLDFFEFLDLEKLAEVLQLTDKKIIFTLRKKTQGGFYTFSGKQRLQDIEKLMSLKIDYFDIEYDVEKSFLDKIKTLHPNVKIILSYHNFQSTDESLSLILSDMKSKGAHLYKIATFANSSLDALRLLDFSKDKDDVIAISMGEKGSFARVLAPIFGSKIVYTYFDKKIAPGQMSLHDLVNIYNISNINKNTNIYALIGDPISQSIGHIFHNERFKKEKRDAIYVKIRLEDFELENFFTLVKKLGFKGFSVTMPLKQKVIKYVDEDLSKIQVVNTIEIKEQKIIGYNTDGKAAIDAIEEILSVKSKKVVILGSGGAAKAIACESKKRGAIVYILNRDEKKAYALAKELSCEGYGLDKFKALNDIDVLINATSCSMQNLLPIDMNYLDAKTVALDIVSNPQNTIFLQKANEKGALCIPGYKMFIKQAKEQFKN